MGFIRFRDLSSDAGLRKGRARRLLAQILGARGGFRARCGRVQKKFGSTLRLLASSGSQFLYP